jgi:hypothetical protein
MWDHQLEGFGHDEMMNDDRQGETKRTPKQANQKN